MSIDPDEVKERIRRMTDIVELIGEQIPLRQQGRLFVGLCPWHADARPSLKVDPERQNWKCWVCNLSGDCYEYVMRREGMTFPEAKRYLADRAGILLPEQSRGPRATPGSPDDKNTLYQAMAWAVEQYHRYLLDASQAQVARDYLSRRQINASSIERFQVGFAPPEWTWLLHRAKKTTFSPDVLEAVGLVAISERTGRYYDVFRGRVLFPIFDPQNRPVGFGGRRLDELVDENEKSAKYINSRDTRLFSKSEQLYGLNLAKDAIRQQGRALLMEGYTDVVIAQQSGLENVVAILGTALVQQHIQILRRFAPEVTLVLDGDEAGRKRANEVLEIFLAHQLDLRVATLPERLDPCDFLLEHGREAMETLIAEAPDALEHKISVETDGLDLVNDTQRANAALQRLLSMLASAPEPRLGITSSERLIWEEQILNRLSRLFRVTEETLRTRLSELRRAKRRGDRPQVGAENHTPALPQLERFEQELFELLLQVPDAALQALERIPESELPSSTGRTLHRVMYELAKSGEQPNFHDLMRVCEDPAIRHLLVDLDMSGREKSCSEPDLALKDLLRTWDHQQIDAELRRCLLELSAGVPDPQREQELLRQTFDLRRRREQ